MQRGWLVLMVSFLLLSAAKLCEASLAASGEPTVAVGTAAAFFVLCLVVHKPPRGMVVRARWAVLAVIYGIKLWVAIHFGVAANAPRIVAMLGLDPAMTSHTVLVARALANANNSGDAILMTGQAIISILVYDTLVLLLELVRVDGAPGHELRRTKVW